MCESRWYMHTSATCLLPLILKLSLVPCIKKLVLLIVINCYVISILQIIRCYSLLLGTYIKTSWCSNIQIFGIKIQECLYVGINSLISFISTYVTNKETQWSVNNKIQSLCGHISKGIINEMNHAIYIIFYNLSCQN